MDLPLAHARHFINNISLNFQMTLEVVRSHFLYGKQNLGSQPSAQGHRPSWQYLSQTLLCSENISFSSGSMVYDSQSLSGDGAAL